MAEIRVPKTPKKAFDRTRRPSSLLLGQIEHLEWAVLPASRRKPYQLPRKQVKTEGQAAERVAQLMAMLREPGGRATGALTPGAGTPAAAPVPVILPPLPKVTAPAIATARPKHRPTKRTRGTSKSATRRRSGR